MTPIAADIEDAEGQPEPEDADDEPVELDDAAEPAVDVAAVGLTDEAAARCAPDPQPPAARVASSPARTKNDRLGRPARGW